MLAMQQRLLGRTGIQVSELAFGGVEIGLPYGIGVHREQDMLSEKEAVRLLHAALDAGINFYDTARLYGQSEQLMGKAFWAKRKEVVLATKCKHITHEAGKLPGYSTLKKNIEQSLLESLGALQTDYIDVYMLHQADQAILENEDVADIFAALKRSGIIRATGVSTYTPQETAQAIASGAWDLVQLPFNLLDQQQAVFFQQAAQQGVALVVRSVLMKGLLSSRGKNLHPALKKVEQHIGQLEQLVNGAYADLPTLATKFALSFPEIAAVLVGIDKPEYLAQALQVANGQYLDPVTLSKAKAMAYPDPGFLNLAQWSREGWLP